MNDLMPPPPRQVPNHVRERVHRLLDVRAGEPVTTGGAADSRHWTASALVTAAVVALVIGGTVAVGNGTIDLGASGSDPGPAGPAPQPTGAIPPTAPDEAVPANPRRIRQTQETLPARPDGVPSGGQAASVPADAGEAYARCIDAVRQSGGGRGGDGLEGVVAAVTSDVATVVVTDGRQVFACNVAPDTAVNHPIATAPAQDPDAGTFGFAMNDTRNYGLGPGDLFWAGGVLPAGVTSLAYVFPDGHREPAVVQDGYWVVQYMTDTGLGGSLLDLDPVEVLLSGPGGRSTVSVPFGGNECNQITHGC